MGTIKRIGITLGDINGIGPEVALRAARAYRKSGHRLVLIGDAAVAARQAGALRMAPPPAWDPAGAGEPSRRVSVWDPGPETSLKENPGRLSVRAARAAHRWILAGADACLEGRLHALVTAPINKEGFARAGIDVPGHTELLAERTGTERFAMMLFGGPLRVVLVTRHIPVAAVPAALTRKAILEAVGLTHEALPWLGVTRKKVAVCGLNPHAGDGGQIGREELDVIAPAIRLLRRRGMNLVGPVPADTVFHQAVRGDFDAVVAMYHDQGLAPLKMLAFDQGVNVTLGLPLVRTSPDHGTAYAIAGKGLARHQSMLEAIKTAGMLAGKKNPWARG